MDRREDILARLLAIASGIDGVTRAYRNKDEIPETSRPAIVILDGDEAANDADPSARPTTVSPFSLKSMVCAPAGGSFIFIWRLLDH